MNVTALAPAAAGFALVSMLLLGGCASQPPVEEPPPPPAPLPVRATIEKVSADGLFAFGQSRIDAGSAGAAELEMLASHLAGTTVPVRAVHVIGHSDRIGSDRANSALSTQRAEAVRDFLVERGVEAGLVTAIGRGSIEPVVECSDERDEALVECLAPNRRVEVRISYGD